MSKPPSLVVSGLGDGNTSERSADRNNNSGKVNFSSEEPATRLIPSRLKLHCGDLLRQNQIVEDSEDFDETRLRLFGLLFNKTPRTPRANVPLSSASAPTTPVSSKSSSSSSSSGTSSAGVAETSKKPSSARSSHKHAPAGTGHQSTAARALAQSNPNATSRPRAESDVSGSVTERRRPRSSRWKRLSAFGTPRRRPTSSMGSDGGGGVAFPGVNFHQVSAGSTVAPEEVAPSSYRPAFPGVNFHEVAGRSASSASPAASARPAAPQRASSLELRSNDSNRSTTSSLDGSGDDATGAKKGRSKRGKHKSEPALVAAPRKHEIVEVTTRDIKMDDGSELLQVWYAGERYKTFAVRKNVTAQEVCSLGVQKLAINAMAESSAESEGGGGAFTTAGDVIRLFVILNDNLRGLRVVGKDEQPIQLREIAEQSGATVQFVFNLTRPCINIDMRRLTFLRWATWLLQQSEKSRSLLVQICPPPAKLGTEHLANGALLLQMASLITGQPVPENGLPDLKKLDRPKYRIATLRAAFKMLRSNAITLFVQPEQVSLGNDDEILDLLWILSLAYHAKDRGIAAASAFEYFLSQIQWCQQNSSKDERFGDGVIQDLNYSFQSGLALNALLAGLAPGQVNPDKLTKSSTENICRALLKADKLFFMPNALLDFKFFEQGKLDDLAISVYLSVLYHQVKRKTNDPAGSSSLSSSSSSGSSSEDEEAIVADSIQAVTEKSEAPEKQEEDTREPHYEYRLEFKGFPRHLRDRSDLFQLQSRDPKLLLRAVNSRFEMAHNPDALLRIKLRTSSDALVLITELEELPHPRSNPALLCTYLVKRRKT